MDALQVQAKLNAGYAKAAGRLGSDFSVYRPAAAEDPLLDLVVVQNAAFSQKDYSYLRVNKHGENVWFCLTDGTLTRRGDYLVGPDDTYFVALQQLNLPIYAVKCNRRVQLLRMPAAAAVGAVGYSGSCQAEADVVLGTAGAAGAFGTGWPASILLRGRSEQTGTGLPDATRNAGWEVLLPSSVPVEIMASDILLDDLGRRYAVHAAEQSDLGWRLQTVEEHA